MAGVVRSTISHSGVKKGKGVQQLGWWLLFTISVLYSLYALYMGSVEVAFQYTDTPIVTELAFANTINTPDGGSHLTGLRSAITSVINRFVLDVEESAAELIESVTFQLATKELDPGRSAAPTGESRAHA
ncbi:MAG: hypothetical protein HC828_10485 [Blastochloris sp.]|nr:hypothetical protein [Blastochloris sp.]